MDIEYLLLLQNLRELTGGCFDNFFAFITTVAVDFYVMVPALILFWAVDKKKGALVALSYGTGCFYNAILKNTFCVYRPWIRDSRVKPLESVLSGATGYSFSSGHSTSAGGFYFGVISAYRKHRGICVFSLVMLGLTMFSRNFVGVHTPQDVLVGALLGICAAATATLVLGWAEKHPDKDWMVVLVAALLVGAVLLYIRFKQYPMDYVDGVLLVDPKKLTVDGFKDPGVFTGVLLGWFVECRFVRFEIKGEPAQEVQMCLAGSLMYIFYENVVVNPLGKAVGIGVVYFMLKVSAPLLFMTLYPWAAAKMINRKRS